MRWKGKKMEGEKMKGIIKFLDKMEDIFLLLIHISLFLIGIYALFDSYMVYKDANDTSLLKYKPGVQQETAEKEIQGNMVGWITMDDTKIDYPVMQGEDNHEYLNKNPYGEYSLSGSIFLDCRNESCFKDDYSLIYGHHMEHGMMFGALDKYLDESYFETHAKGTLTAGDATYHIQLFAVMETEATNALIFAPTETAAGETLDYIKGHAIYCDKNVKTDNCRILGLSTCKYPDTADRTIVFGVLSE